MKALRFVCKDGGSLCVRCAIMEDTFFGPTDCPDEDQWAILGAQLEDEDCEVEPCDHCGNSLFVYPFVGGVAVRFCPDHPA